MQRSGWTKVWKPQVIFKHLKEIPGKSIKLSGRKTQSTVFLSALGIRNTRPYLMLTMTTRVQKTEKGVRMAVYLNYRYGYDKIMETPMEETSPTDTDL